MEWSRGLILSAVHCPRLAAVLEQEVICAKCSRVHLEIAYGFLLLIFMLFDFREPLY